jgi:hypothetical protein
LTVTLTSSLALSVPSDAVSRSTYDPATVNVAVVVSAAGVPNVTVPGPLTLVQAFVTDAGGLGNPSSVTVPTKLAVAGSVIVWSTPAFTVGA